MREEKRPFLLWVSTINPRTSLDAITWLATSAELHQLGWRVCLIGKGSPDRYTRNGVEICCVPHPPVYFWGQWVFHLGVWRLLWQMIQDVDVVLFHQISALWLFPWMLWRQMWGEKRPFFVMDSRDLPDFSQGTLKLRLRRQLYRLVYRLATRLADGQTAITPRMARLVQIPPHQLWGIWPSGVLPEQFAPCQQQRQWPAPDEPIQLIYIGRLMRERNLAPLAEAVIAANKEGARFTLTLIGDGDDADRLTALAKANKSALTVLPPIPHTEIPTRLAQAHVGVTSLPAHSLIKYQASSPVKLFEYLAAGMPVLAMRNVCHTEVVGNGRFAFWIESPDPVHIRHTLHQLWENRQQLPRLAADAAQVARQWTWQASAQKLHRALLTGSLAHIPANQPEVQ
ncbi:MAG: glycosyltransferase [Chloroflexi bacterium]|nr:MAG: glycosyltransferase [Chloroflexota bacterium]